MTHTRFDTILDECLARLAAGDSIDVCLRSYPQQTAELQPLLEAAASLRALPQPQLGAAAVEAGKQRMIAAYRQQKLDRAGSVPLLTRYARQVRELFVPKGVLQPRHGFRFAVVVLLVLFVGTNLAVVASAGSIPGDPLYGVKRSWEETRLALALRDRNRQRLHQEFLERREDEVRELQRRGRQGTLELEGVLQASGEDQWSIHGLAFQLTRQTRMEGALAAGTTARVRLQVLNDGTLVALEMRSLTRPSPPVPEPEPRRTPGSSGRVPTDAAGNTPTQSLEQEPRTPEATSTPGDTAAPEPTEAPEPEWMRCVECTDEPSAETGEPRQTAETHEPEHTPLPGPTEMPEPEYTAGPIETHEPRHTPAAESTETPEPEHTPAAGPTGTREPGETAEPPETREPEHTSGPAETQESDHRSTSVPTGGPPYAPGPTGAPQPSPEATHPPEVETPVPGSHSTPQATRHD